MQKLGISIVLFAVLSGYVGLSQGAIEEKVVLMFDGKQCIAYLGEVESALKKIVGVKAVDMKSMKGHAIVTVQGDKAEPNQLVKAVNEVKGDGWHCSAQVMK